MTDLKLYHTQDGAEINVVNGLAEMDNGLGTAFYLSLVGVEYWGNAIEQDTRSHFRGRTQALLKSLPITTANLARIQSAVKLDLAWASDEIIAVSVNIPRRNYVGVVVNTEVQSYEYLLPWEQTQ